jgi:HK97 family phage prohead protease
MANKKLPQTGSRETRAFSMPDLSADETGNTVEGHAAVFGQTYDMFWYTETIARGTFDKTDFTDVLFSINHDLKKLPLARSRNNNANSTLQLQVDDTGLNTKAALDVENNSEAKALYSSIQRGDMNGMSYIFTVRDDEWTGLDTDKPQRTITDIAKVYEVSAVSMPANPGTDINARSQSELESCKSVLESARAKAGELESEQRQSELEVLKLKNQILMKG